MVVVKAPTCPECCTDQADRVDGRWYCRGCELVYRGTQAEWDAHRYHRARRLSGLPTHHAAVQHLERPAQQARARLRRAS